MRRSAVCLLTAACLVSASVPPTASAQSQTPPHAWLFGAWTGGLFPPPGSETATQCLAQPTVIFTRDLVLTGSLLETTYTQHTVQTVRVTATGADIRFAEPPAPVPSPLLGLTTPQTPPGLGCDTPDELTITRRGENEIQFANCPQYPNPLVRCPSR